jgi:hypothetical protein
MQRSANNASRIAGDDRLLLAGMLLWTVALVVQWPLALSFGDEVGYVGQAKLLLEGHIRPLADSPGVWTRTPQGLVAQYPLLVPLLLTPLVAIDPRLVFLAGIAAALATAWIAGRVLRQWGRPSTWALLVLVHPTVILLARTAMADLLLAAFVVGAWWSLRNERRVATVALLALTVAAKPIGFLLAIAIVAGEVPHLVWRSSETTAARRRIPWGIAGLLLGFALAGALNLLATGRLWFAYDHGFVGTPPFWPRYFLTTGPIHLRSLLLLPPLLIAGVWPFWRQRSFGPLLLIAGQGLMMCCYFFVDVGRNWLETLLLAPRLVLPVVVLLLIGYGDLLAAGAARIVGLRRVVVAVLVILPAVVGLGLSARHRRWQAPAGTALATASRLAGELGVNELGMTESAAKVGVLYRGHSSWILNGQGGAPLVLCSSQSWSYRSSERPVPCRIPGYDTKFAHDDFHFLVRRPARLRE